MYFFRPLGMAFALAARSLRLSPTQVTLIGAVVGIAGGALLFDPDLGLLAFALLILHGVLDSSDGQLARMTGQVTELGRLLDGVGGYLAHIAIYLALLAGSFSRGGDGTMLWWAVAAGISNIVQAQLYDYHRTAYAKHAIRGEADPTGSSRHVDSGPEVGGAAPTAAPGIAPHRRVIDRYEHIQLRIAGEHPAVERAISRRAATGAVLPEDRARYRQCFYWPVRGWNLFGDNTRFYSIGVLAWLQHPEWFFYIIAGPMNLALACVWLWQRRADRRFLAGL